MHSLNRLYLRTAGGREFVMCGVNSTLPLGVAWETPTECLWNLRGAARCGQLFGVRDFLARESLVPVVGYPSDADESMRVLEQMIERGWVAGYFPEGHGPGASLDWGLGSGAPPALPFPEAKSMDDLLAYAQSFAGGKAARKIPSSSPPRGSQSPPARIPPTTPDSGFETVAEDGPAAAASPPGDLVAVAKQFLGTGNTTQANKPETGSASGTEDRASSVENGSEDPGLVAAQAPAKETAPQMHDYALRVVDEDGKPVDGIEITFGPSAKDPMKATDAEGWARTTSPLASLEVSFKLPKPAMG